jgi:hypothetical protein
MQYSLILSKMLGFSPRFFDSPKMTGNLKYQVLEIYCMNKETGAFKM